MSRARVIFQRLLPIAAFIVFSVVAVKDLRGCLPSSEREKLEQYLGVSTRGVSNVTIVRDGGLESTQQVMFAFSASKERFLRMMEEGRMKSGPRNRESQERPKLKYGWAQWYHPWTVKGTEMAIGTHKRIEIGRSVDYNCFWIIFDSERSEAFGSGLASSIPATSEGAAHRYCADQGLE